MKKYLRILAAVLVGTMLLSTSALACTGVCQRPGHLHHRPQ